MTAYKRTLGDYNIVSIDPSAGDNLNIVTHTLNLTGNLDVTGNVTYINVNDLTVDDPFITVAGNNAGSGNSATFPQQGLVAQTGSASYAGIRFNNVSNSWEISSNVAGNGAPVTAYQAIGIASAGSVAGPVTSIQFNDVGNVFGGNATFTYDYANTKVTLTGHQVFGNIGTAPTAVANSVAVYNNAQGSGGTGLYVKSTTVQDELVSKSKAIVFAIIF
jgi:hypothetical protein